MPKDLIWTPEVQNSLFRRISSFYNSQHNITCNFQHKASPGKLSPNNSRNIDLLKPPSNANIGSPFYIQLELCSAPWPKQVSRMDLKSTKRTLRPSGNVWQ